MARLLSKVLRGLAVAFVASALISGTARASGEMHLLLELQRTQDGKTIEKISLWGTDIDPNTRSADDRYELKVNDTQVNAPQSLLAALDHARRGYSYDAMTNGVMAERAQIVCNMAGQAKGQHLLTRYLTYDTAKIVDARMQTVLSEPMNCLYVDHVHPNTDASHLAAAKALGGLSALLDMHTH